MKKIIAILAMSILLVSCGAETELSTVDENEVPIVEGTEVENVTEESLSEEEINEAIEELFNDSAE